MLFTDRIPAKITPERVPCKVEENNYTEMIALVPLATGRQASPANGQQWVSVYLHGFEISEN
jgi:hypothetical protein